MPSPFGPAFRIFTSSYVISTDILGQHKGFRQMKHT